MTDKLTTAIIETRHTMEWLIEERDRLEAENRRLADTLKGLVGLVQLVRSRDDCPVAIKQALTDQYRLDDAFAAIALAERDVRS